MTDRSIALSMETIFKIREDYLNGCPRAFLSAKYGIKESFVDRVVMGQCGDLIPLSPPKRFTRVQVADMLLRLQEGTTNMKKLAEKYRVDRTAITRVISKRELYPDLPRPNSILYNKGRAGRPRTIPLYSGTVRKKMTAHKEIIRDSARRSVTVTERGAILRACLSGHYKPKAIVKTWNIRHVLLKEILDEHKAHVAANLM
jgi:hypothetical protein